MLALHGEPVALYDIKADILEQINLINEKPEKKNYCEMSWNDG